MTESASDRVPELLGMPRSEALYAMFAAIFAVMLVLTNIVGVKLFQIFPDGRPGWMPGEGPLALTTGIITYPITFLCTDLVAEIWGRRRAQWMVWLGFAMSLLMLGVVAIARALPPSPIWATEAVDMEGMQAAFEVSFQYPAVLLGASMTAYLVAQLFDVHLYHFWWRITRGRHMWIRNNGSTSISQLVDTCIVNGIFLPLAFGMELGAVVDVIMAVYLCKLALAVIDTPLIYLGRAGLRRALALPVEADPLRAPLASAD